MVNENRIKNEFIRLIMIDSPSLWEKELAQYLADKLTALGAEITFDRAGGKIGGNCGNLLARIPANCTTDCPALMFNAHLDTVKARNGIEPVLENGVFRSRQDTILAADDKSGIAAILEMARVLREQKLPHGELELVFTVAEEVGLLGAKNLDYGWVKAKVGFALDGGNPQQVINAAPASNRMRYKIHGLAAHAGVHPEDGISAVQIAGRAISRMPLGRIDEETTANIGTIKGGNATNIIPDYVEIAGEARSHSMAKLEAQTEAMSEALRQSLAEFRLAGVENLPRLEEEVWMEYHLMNVPEDSLGVRLVKQGGIKLGREFELARTGGGSDANIFNGNGIATVILGTGMHNPHTTKEYLALSDMVSCAELLVELARVR